MRKEIALKRLPASGRRVRATCKQSTTTKTRFAQQHRREHTHFVVHTFHLFFTTYQIIFLEAQDEFLRLDGHHAGRADRRRRLALRPAAEQQRLRLGRRPDRRPAAAQSEQGHRGVQSAGGLHQRAGLLAALPPAELPRLRFVGQPNSVLGGDRRRRRLADHSQGAAVALGPGARCSLQ